MEQISRSVGLCLSCRLLPSSSAHGHPQSWWSFARSAFHAARSHDSDEASIPTEGQTLEPVRTGTQWTGGLGLACHTVVASTYYSQNCYLSGTSDGLLVQPEERRHHQPTHASAAQASWWSFPGTCCAEYSKTAPPDSFFPLTGARGLSMAWGTRRYPLTVLIPTSQTHAHLICCGPTPNYTNEFLTREVDAQSILPRCHEGI